MRLTRKRITTGALALVAAMLMAAAVFAQKGDMHTFGGPPHGEGGHEHGGPGGPGDMLGHLVHELNLTDAQQTQVKQLMDNFHTSTQSLHEQLFKAGGGPLDGLTDNFDEAGVRAAAQSRANMQVELEVAHAKLMSQVYSILTAEQKAKVAELRQHFEQMHRQPPPPPPSGTENVPTGSN
jgi:protein CpxP